MAYSNKKKVATVTILLCRGFIYKAETNILSPGSKTQAGAGAFYEQLLMEEIINFILFPFQFYISGILYLTKTGTRVTTSHVEIEKCHLFL